MFRGAAIAGVALVSLFASASASSAATFEAAVETVLMGQKSGPITELDANAKGKLIACVIKVLQKVPEGKQRYVAEGADFTQMEDRFGEVVMADRAKFKQQITLECGELATKK